MKSTFLIGSPNYSWREWLRSNRNQRDLLCLDPDEPELGYPARLALYRDGRPVFTRFFGSLDPQRAPHVITAAVAEAIPLMRENAIVQGFKYRATPVLRQTLLIVTQLLNPSQILVPAGLTMSRHGFPVGPEEVELPVAFPPMVHHAQRKAQWLKLLESTEEHVIPIHDLPTEGARWGSGIAMKPSLIPGCLHLEATGSTLLAVCPDDPDPRDIAKALDMAGCSKAEIATPEDYNGLLCAFCRDSGEEFGFGMIQSIDWERQNAHIRSTAIPPAPVRLLRVGGLRISDRGKEMGEVRMGSV